MSRTQLLPIVVVTTAAWALTLIAEGARVDLDWLRSFGIVVFAVTASALAFDRFLWRIPPIPRWLNRPMIHGTWRGYVRSNYRADPLECFLAVRQTFSEISVYLIHEKGSSHSIATQWRRSEAGEPAVFHIYQVVPDLESRAGDPIRYGGCILEACGRPLTKLKGPYWTDGLTRGQVSFSERNDAVLTDYESAAAATYQSVG